MIRILTRASSSACPPQRALPGLTAPRIGATDRPVFQTALRRRDDRRSDQGTPSPGCYPETRTLIRAPPAARPCQGAAIRLLKPVKAVIGPMMIERALSSSGPSPPPSELGRAGAFAVWVEPWPPQWGWLGPNESDTGPNQTGRRRVPLDRPGRPLTITGDRAFSNGQPSPTARFGCLGCYFSVLASVAFF